MQNFQSMALKYENNTLWVLDQTRLPLKEVWLACSSPEDMVGMIQKLQTRGAPLIGVAAAMALASFSETRPGPKALFEAAQKLAHARPTAVNLMSAMRHLVLDQPQEFWEATSIVPKAYAWFNEDVQLCLSMAKNGASLIEEGDQILTHCNAGGLATAGIGTALGVIREAHEQGKKIHVYVDETRPLWQGARLTSWELTQLKIPHTLICDNMAAFLMAQKKINKIFVGADRIAANGDFANKIGTYSLAVNAYYHGVGFYPVAPVTTVDKGCQTGSDIPIEERPTQEVASFNDQKFCLPETKIYNPAFDVTPQKLVTALVLNNGIFYPKDLALKKHCEF